jgi:hypothetical protein
MSNQPKKTPQINQKPTEQQATLQETEIQQPIEPQIPEIQNNPMYAPIPIEELNEEKRQHIIQNRVRYNMLDLCYRLSQIHNPREYIV